MQLHALLVVLIVAVVSISDPADAVVESVIAVHRHGARWARPGLQGQSGVYRCVSHRHIACPGVQLFLAPTGNTNPRRSQLSANNAHFISSLVYALTGLLMQLALHQDGLRCYVCACHMSRDAIVHMPLDRPGRKRNFFNM